jgi:FkbM family methyltransferase
MKTKFNTILYQISKKDFVNFFHTNSLLYALFPKDNAVTSSILEGWQYESYMFDFLEQNQIDCGGKDIIDIGANNGNFTVDFAHLVGDNGKVHSFEPQRIIYYQLCTNVFLNGIDNAYCHNVALGDKNEFVKIEKPDYFSEEYVNFGNVRVNETSENFEMVESKKLDDYEFNNIVFIKIDVQGYEPFVIDGAIKTIEKHRPYLFVEFEEPLLNKFGSSEESLLNKIESLGYVVKRFQEGVPFNTETGKCLDCVCIPNEKFEEFEHKIT